MDLQTRIALQIGQLVIANIEMSARIEALSEENKALHAERALAPHPPESRETKKET